MAAPKIPDELKADLPQTLWGKILSATPVVMAVVATALAGLASSEMTRAQYSRSLAAQQQSKAGDQWGFFQAKRLRGAMQRSTLDVLRNTTQVRALDSAMLAKISGGSELGSAAGQPTLAALLSGELPAIPPVVIAPEIKSALEAIESSRAESEIAPLITSLKESRVEEALRAAKDRAQAFDNALKPISQSVDKLEAGLSGGTSDPDLLRAFTVARLRFTAARYDAEARLNQSVAQFLEIRVRQSNLTAERHHRRSQRFFFGMLATQAAVIVSTLAMAAKKRNLLWSLAAAAGLAAIGFAVYVYLYI